MHAYAALGAIALAVYYLRKEELFDRMDQISRVTQGYAKMMTESVEASSAAFSTSSTSTLSSRADRGTTGKRVRCCYAPWVFSLVLTRQRERTDGQKTRRQKVAELGGEREAVWCWCRPLPPSRTSPWMVPKMRFQPCRPS